MIIKGSRTNIIIISKARQMISIYSFITILIEAIYLPEDRDLLFEPSQLDALTLSTYIVNYTFSKIIIRNNLNLSIILIRRTRLDKVLKYKVEEYFLVATKYIIIINKPLKRETS